MGDSKAEEEEEERKLESHMRSEASVLAVVSREKDGSWTMMSPLHVVDHRACRLGGPEIPRHSQQQSDNRDSWRHRIKEQRRRDRGRPRSSA